MFYILINSYSTANFIDRIIDELFLFSPNALMRYRFELLDHFQLKFF